MNQSKLKLARQALNDLRRQHAQLIRSAELTLRAIEAVSGSVLDGGDPRVQLIKDLVADDYLVPVDAFVAPTRGSPNVCEARAVAMVLCREILRLSAPVVGVEFRRDHGSVLWSERRVADLLSVEKKFAERVTRLRAACAESLTRRAA